MKISPHGKVPVLKVGEEILFESNAIAEYLDEVAEPRLHPTDPIKRARNRAWTDFVPSFSAGIRPIYYGKTKEEHEDGVRNTAPAVLAKLEQALTEERGNDGPYFNGPELSMVDAGYAPFLNRLALVEEAMHSKGAELGLLAQFPKVAAWTAALRANDSVIHSVPEEFATAYPAGLVRGGYYVARYFEDSDLAAE